jgi:hypothetical protein
VTGPSGVDRLCEALFLSPSAQEKDDNLLFVRDRLLRSEADRAALLDLYAQVRSGRWVAVDDTNQLVSILRLSGIVRTLAGRLQVRNQIYERVFDLNWITSHMPDAELRRQRAAYWRGLLRAAGVAGVILMVMAGLVLASMHQAELARRATTREARQRRLAERRLYNADMLLAQQAWEEEDVGRALGLLMAHQPGPGQEDLRGFEWRYLRRLCQGDQRFTLRASAEGVGGAAVAPGSKTLAWGSASGVVKLWDLPAKREMATFSGHKDAVTSVAFSPDGRTLVSGSEDSRVILWDVEKRRAVATLQGHRGGVRAVALSPDGTMLASGGRDRSIRLWDLPSGRQLASLDAEREVACVAFSPDGRRVASGCDYDTTVRL